MVDEQIRQLGQSVPITQDQKTPPIEWDPKRKLTWDDFKGAADESKCHLAAESAVYIDYKWNCDEKGKFTFTVKAIFVPDESWVKAEKKSDEVLAHEQGHFDLQEVCARKLRKALSELKDPCKNMEKTKKEIAELEKKNKEECEKEQKQYDEETDHGTKKNKQKEWEKKMKDQLK